MTNHIKNFFTPIVWSEDSNPGPLDRAAEAVDDYFYFTYKDTLNLRTHPPKAHVINKGTDNSITADIHNPKWWDISNNEPMKNVAKVLSLGLLVKRIPIVPLTALLFKAGYRFTHPVSDYRMTENKVIHCKQKMKDIGYEMSERKFNELRNGHGEFIVYEETNNGKQAINRNDYLNIYHEINRIRQKSGDGISRDSMLEVFVKSINPNYEIAFTPRTLYDLTVVKAAIEEDLSRGSICPKANFYYDQKEELSDRGKCWHDGRFRELGNNEDPDVIRLAYETNNLFVDLIPEHSKRFNFDDIQRISETQFQFFHELHRNSKSEMSKKAYAMCDMYTNDLLNDTNGLLVRFCQDDVRVKDGPTFFVVETNEGTIVGEASKHYTMGISTSEITNIYRNALALECSQIAVENAIMYRGADLKQDYPANYNTYFIEPRSISYSTSILASSFSTGGECVAHYGTKELRKTGTQTDEYTYALAVPYKELGSGNSLFFTPFEEHPISQLKSLGQLIHGRTRLWKNAVTEENSHREIEGLYDDIPKYLESDIPKNVLLKSYEKQREQAFILNDNHS